MRPAVLLFLSAVCLSYAKTKGQYSIPEGMAEGSEVGNIMQDFGLELKPLKSRKARVQPDTRIKYIDLSDERGVLVIKEKIDREDLCVDTTPCTLHYKLILENPQESFDITVEITDINDNAPRFTNTEANFIVNEWAKVGSKFELENATDSDIGKNALLKYSLTPDDTFALIPWSGTDGGKKLEMILQKPLDPEKQPNISLLLTAVDGGEPQMSATMNIFVKVEDVNDNAPKFAKLVYRAEITENSAAGTSVTTVRASDVDFGPNGHVSYSLRSGPSSKLFKIDKKTGEITLVGEIDHEKAKTHEIHVQAVDSRGLTGITLVKVEVIDINDNIPEIKMGSPAGSLAEGSAPNTAVAFFHVRDADSENNGAVRCNVEDGVPFIIHSMFNGWYEMVTEKVLDREIASQYDVTVTCSDEGVPPLSSSATITIQILDVNNNAPVFDRSSYEADIKENNPPGVSILTVKATDADWNQNTRVSYILQDSSVNGMPVSSYVSVSADSGVIHAVTTFDYEQIKDFQFYVGAQDGGSPPLSSNVTVKILIQDQNDNPPRVLYPVQNGHSLVDARVPHSAHVGYLVTTVVAVDEDSGENACLSYKLENSTERALFEVGLQNGQIQTIRNLSEDDAVKQRLTVTVEDNGRPSRSATAVVNLVVVADRFPEVSVSPDLTHNKENDGQLVFYLKLALTGFGLCVTCLLVVMSVKIYRWRRSRVMREPNVILTHYSKTLGDVDKLQRLK